MIIKWINRYSREEGYVYKVNKRMGYFENTFDKTEAKNYTPKLAEETADWLRNQNTDNEYVIMAK